MNAVVVDDVARQKMNKHCPTSSSYNGFGDPAPRPYGARIQTFREQPAELQEVSGRTTEHPMPHVHHNYTHKHLHRTGNRFKGSRFFAWVSNLSDTLRTAEGSHALVLPPYVVLQFYLLWFSRYRWQSASFASEGGTALTTATPRVTYDYTLLNEKTEG